MKIKFMYVRRYYLELNRLRKNKLPWEEVVRLGTLFENKYRKQIEQIPKIIAQVMKKEWKRDVIEAYIVDKAGPSFAFPLTIKIRDDLLLVLVILVHELIHILLKEGEADREEEKKINEITAKVLEELGVDAEEQLRKLREWTE